MIALEFSRPVAVDHLGHEPKRFTIEASAEECAALARRFGLEAVDSLVAELVLQRIGGTALLRLKGRLVSDVVQTCVVSLEPVPAHLEEEFELAYGQDEQAESEEVEFDLDEPDPPEPIADGIIDLGEAVAEHLALALDPFPRAPGAEFAAGPADREEDGKSNPFAALAGLKKK